MEFVNKQWKQSSKEQRRNFMKTAMKLAVRKSLPFLNQSQNLNPIIVFRQKRKSGF